MKNWFHLKSKVNHHCPVAAVAVLVVVPLAACCGHDAAAEDDLPVNEVDFLLLFNNVQYDS